MVRRVAKEGGVWHEPPYTFEEEMELYRRVDGPITILHGPPPSAPETPYPTTPPPPVEK